MTEGQKDSKALGEGVGTTSSPLEMLVSAIAEEIETERRKKETGQKVVEEIAHALFVAEVEWENFETEKVAHPKHIAMAQVAVLRMIAVSKEILAVGDTALVEGN